MVEFGGVTRNVLTLTTRPKCLMLKQHPDINVYVAYSTLHLTEILPNRASLHYRSMRDWCCISSSIKSSKDIMAASPKYLSGDIGAVKEFLDRFDVSHSPRTPRILPLLMYGQGIPPRLRRYVDIHRCSYAAMKSLKVFQVFSGQAIMSSRTSRRPSPFSVPRASEQSS